MEQIYLENSVKKILATCKLKNVKSNHTMTRMTPESCKFRILIHVPLYD